MVVQTNYSDDVVSSAREKLLGNHDAWHRFMPLKKLCLLLSDFRDAVPANFARFSAVVGCSCSL